MRAILVLLLAAASAIAGSRARAEPAIIELPVSFAVVNTNTSALPCDADGLPYTVRGHLVMPEAGARTVTVYVNGSTITQANWSLGAVPGLDNPREMAADGHASLVYDMLGHGESLPRPPGTAKCVGSEADVLHQLVTKLRSGDYVAGADRPPQFDAVATVGHSMGSLVALVESYSYDDTGALVLTGAAHQITAARRTAVALGHAVPQIAQCPADEDGWFYQWPSPQAEASDIFYDPDPRIVDALKSAVEEESCTVQETTGFGLLWDQAFTPMVDVPVLVANGEHDFFFDPTATYLERYRYPSSPDVDTVVVPDAGHTYMIERPDTARAFRAVVGTWLTRRGF